MRGLVAPLLAMLVAACAALQPADSATRQVREIIDDTVQATRAMPEEQGRRLARAQKQYAATPDDANRVRLGAMLATLPPPWRDEERAATLLGPVAGRRPESALTQLAGLLAAGVAERQRLARDLRVAEERAEGAARREESATERANTLQQQLEALKSIERDVLEREERRRTLKR
ncbi:MAG: hypothetical protein OEV81_00435 [Betaproteobacteria bacterium]|nr:hypothetical protein [Betaproteobacteria bacterium]MDH5220610.1 hypothetical protein [Betaproteobacteria bacterium]MDH5350309.1 hypothetical protein [Betaproteobacteria bacterium]